MGEIFAGRYELIDPIGRGGVGTVWRAWDHRRRRYVAAKVLQQSDAYTLLRFVREQSLRIDHPHVLAPASWAADDDKVLFTMDLMSGGSLAHLIGDYGPLPPTFVCTLLDQLLAGLTAVHAEEVVHRDIKPANILLEPTGTGRPHLRLSDFGISMRKGEPRLTETNFVVGTPGYFAPEQMLGAEPDFTADLYAAGLVGVYLLTGRKPDARALLEEYEHGMPGPPEGVPEPLWQVLGQLLQPDPQARFRTATGARKALASSAELLTHDSTLEQEIVEVFDHLGPLPEGFGPDGPLDARNGSGTAAGGPGSGSESGSGSGSGDRPASETGSFHLQPPAEQFGTPAPAPAPASSSPSPSPTAAAAAAPGTGTGTAAVEPAGPVPQAAPPTETPVLGRPAGSEQPSTPPTPTPLAPQPYPYEGGADGAGPYAAQQAPVAPGAQGAPVGPAGPLQGAHAPLTPPAPVSAATRRPGPPPKVAIPLLVLAIVLLGAGIWALSVA